MMTKGNSEGYCEENAATPTVASEPAQADPHVTSVAREWAIPAAAFLAPSILWPSACSAKVRRGLLF
jgi:hypothetical protein